MKYNKKERVFLVKKMAELKSSTLVQRAWRTKFKNKKAPTHKTILYNANKFDLSGSVCYIPSERKKNANKRNESIEALSELFTENCRLSIPKAAVALQISTGLTHTILRRDLKLKPYKYQEYHELQCQDYAKRVDFAEWFLESVEDKRAWFICSDEAYFCLNGSVNKQNDRMWLKARPTDWIEQPLHDQKVLVWCAFSASKFYGPFYFESSVNQHNYLEMLQNFFWPLHKKLRNYKNYYFQQDGATPHTANVVQEWLSTKFGNKFLSKEKWPPRSPDLNPCDFFLWGYLKSKVYHPLPKNICELKENIEREIKKIDKNLLKKIFSNLEKRCDLLIQANGGHIENILV